VVLNLPKIGVSVPDLVKVLGEIDGRVTALEEYVGRNDERISTLEEEAAEATHGLAEHQAGAVHRAREIEGIKAQFNRERWLRNLRRR